MSEFYKNIILVYGQLTDVVVSSTLESCSLFRFTAMIGVLRGNTRPYDNRKSQTDPASIIKSASFSASRRHCLA